MTRFEVVVAAIFALIPAIVVYCVWWSFGWIVFFNSIYTATILIAAISGLKKGAWEE